MAPMLQRPLPDEALGIVAKGKKKNSPSDLAGQHTLDWRGRAVPLSCGRGVGVRVSREARPRLGHGSLVRRARSPSGRTGVLSDALWRVNFSHREKGRGGGHLRLGPRLRSRVDEAHMTFSGALGLRMRAKRVA